MIRCVFNEHTVQHHVQHEVLSFFKLFCDPKSRCLISDKINMISKQDEHCVDSNDSSSKKASFQSSIKKMRD